MTDFQISHFTEGDETFLCNIFNATYEIFNGFSEKNPHQWKASFLLNPQIGGKRIFIARIDNPVEYAAYGKDGSIYDICVKESPYQNMIYTALLVRIIKTATAEGITTLKIHQDFTPKSIQYFTGYTAAWEIGNTDNAPKVIKVECGWQHFGELIFGSKVFWISIITGQLKVSPFKSVIKVKRVMDTIRPQGSWHIPMVDRR